MWKESMEDMELIKTIFESCRDYIIDSYSIRNSFDVTEKAHPNDVLTVVDVNVQKQILGHIRGAYPKDQILAEESGFSQYSTKPVEGRCWIIDPIDGTQNFLRGFCPAFGVSIGLVENGEPVCAGVMLPIHNDTFLAQRGSGAFRNGNRISVSSVDEIGLARVDVEFGGIDGRANALRLSEEIIRDAGQIRAYSCAVFGCLQVAAGEQDAYLLFGTQPWDIAAGMLIVEEAGGRVTGIEGQSVTPFDAESAGVFTNGRLHEACMSRLGLAQGRPFKETSRDTQGHHIPPR